jgi:hypothetical protein
MTTPTGPRRDDPIDGPVRPFLWRLRARLVTPPPEDRVETDLDRVLATARQYAHTAPSPGASSRPGAFEQPGRPRHAAVVALGARRRGAVRVLGQAAAAAVIVAAVGAGALNARDGVVQIEALLGRDGSAVEPATPAPELPDAGVIAAPADPPAPADPAPDDGPAEPAAPSSDDDVVEPEPAPPAEVEEPGPSASEQPTPAPAPAAPATPRRADDAPREPAPAEPEPVPAEPGEVIAAPDPDGGGLDGFGGQRPCDGEDGLPCLPGAEDGTDDTGQDTGVDDQPAADPEELARRRFQPDGEG